MTLFITGYEVVAKVMFLLVSVILLTGGVCLSACWDTPRSRHPPKQTPPPWSRHSVNRGVCLSVCWDTTPPLEQTPPFPWEADSGIRSMSGRYASYWNAFLYFICFSSICADVKVSEIYL